MKKKALRLIAVVAALALAACGHDTYKVTLVADPAEGGEVIGGGTYTAGDTVCIQAKPFEGYLFANWSDGNTSNPRRFRATDNVSLTAYFVSDGSSGGEQPVQPNPDMVVTFGGKVWYGTAVLAKTFNDFGYTTLQLQVVQTGLGEALPMAGLNIPLATGPYASHGDTVFSCFYLPNGSADTLVYNGQTYPHWIALATADTVCCAGTVDALNADAGTVSVSMKARMLDMERYAASGAVETTEMSIRLTNIHYTAQP